MENKISHDGIVDSIQGSHIRIKIVQAAACSSCTVKSACTAAESKEKIVDVWDEYHANTLKTGDKVIVCATQSTGTWAAILSYGFPLLLIIAGVMLQKAGLSELQSAGVALGVLVLYYTGLSAFKKKLNRSFAFWIEETSN
jgi:sigma-E factor negative regulatory protein RseC